MPKGERERKQQMDNQVKKANLVKTNSESNSKGKILQMFRVSETSSE